MRLPDPFKPNLRVESIPEIKAPPVVMSDYTKAMQARCPPFFAATGKKDATSDGSGSAGAGAGKDGKGMPAEEAVANAEQQWTRQPQTSSLADQLTLCCTCFRALRAQTLLLGNDPNGDAKAKVERRTGMAEAAREGLLNSLLADIGSVPPAERASQGAEGDAMVRRAVAVVAVAVVVVVAVVVAAAAAAMIVVFPGIPWEGCVGVGVRRARAAPQKSNATHAFPRTHPTSPPPLQSNPNPNPQQHRPCPC